MAFKRLLGQVKKPVAFLLSLALVLSTLVGLGLGLKSAAATEIGDLPAGSQYQVFGDSLTAAVSGLAVDASTEGKQATLQYATDRWAMQFPAGTSTGDWGYLYCKTDSLPAGTLTVSVDYYDDPALSGKLFEIWYKDSGGGDHWDPVQATGTGAWKTANLVVASMRAGGVNGGNDFRVTDKAAGLAISRIVVSPGSNTGITPAAPDTIPRYASYTVGTSATDGLADKMTLNGIGDDIDQNIGSFGTVAGRNAYTTQDGASGWRYMWFKLDQAFRVLPAQTMTLAVTYYDAASSKGSQFNVWYASDGSNDGQSAMVTLQGTDKWKTAYLSLPASVVKGGLNNGRDLRLTVRATVGTGVTFQKIEFFAYNKPAPPEEPAGPTVSPDPVSVTFTDPILEDGMTFTAANDGGEVPGGLRDVNGTPAWVVTSSVGDGGWVGQLRFKAGTEFASNAGKTVTAVVEYYDDPQMTGGAFEICYNNGTYSPATAIQGAGGWKKAYITLTGVNFGAMSGGGHDFWIIVKKNGMAFSKVTLYDGEVTAPVTGSCYVTFGPSAQETASQNLVWEGGGEGAPAGTFGTVAGQGAYTVPARNPGNDGWNYLWGRIAKGFSTMSTMTINVTYYDGNPADANKQGRWQIWYRTADGADQWTNWYNLGYTGVWKTEPVIVRNTDFNNVTINAGYSFRIATNYADVSFHEVSVVNGGGTFGDAVYVAWGNNTVDASGIRWWTGDYGDGGVYASAGSPAQWGYQINPAGKNDIYIYLDIDDDYLHGGKNKAEITVEYWDGPSGSWGFAYDSVDTPWTYPDGVALKGTNQWATKTFVFDNMAMSNRENGGADMRFEARGGVIVKSISVRKIETVVLEAAAAKPASVFFDTDEVKFGLKITNQTSAAQTLTMSIDVVNPNGASIYALAEIVSAAPKAVVNYPLSLGYNLPKGSYFLNVNLRNAGGSINITERYRFGIITDLTNKPFTFNGWGACAHWGQGQSGLDYTLPLYKQAGVTSIRDEYYWGSVERTKGVYNIDTGNYVKSLHDAGIRPMLILCYGNDLYGGSLYDDPAWLTAYGNYAEAMARAFKGICDTFEVWNEFNGSFGNGRSDSYYGLLKAAYLGVKRGNPNATVVAGGVVGYDDAFIKRVAAYGPAGQEGWRYMEAVSYHYPDRASVTPYAQALKDAIVEISNYQYASVMGKPYPEMWITEIGWSTKVPGGETEAQQAAYIAQLYTELAYNYNKSGSTAMTHYYDFRNDGTNPAEHEQNFGFVDITGAPKPSFVALNNLANLINGRIPGGKWTNVSGRNNLNITEFLGAPPPLNGPVAMDAATLDTDDIYVVWSKVGEQSCNINVGTNNFQVIDPYGNVVPYAIYNGSVNITVGELPIILKGHFTTIPTAGDATFTSAQNVVYVTPGERVSFKINRSGDAVNYSGSYYVQMPLGWSTVSGNTFGPGAQDTITIQVGGDYTAQVGTIVVVAKSLAGDTYATVNISTSTVDAFGVEVYPVAKATGDGWDVAVRLNNNYNAATIPAGQFRVSSPVQSSGTYLFDEIPPQSSQIILVPAPWLSGDFKRDFNFTITAGAGANAIVKKITRSLSALTAVKTEHQIFIDGVETAGEWDGAMTFAANTQDTYRHITGRTWQGPDDLSFVGKTKWDSEYLYVNVTVTDDVQNNTNSPATWWMGDGVQLCIDPYRSADSASTTGFEFFGFAMSTGSPGQTSYAEANSVVGASPGEGLLSAIKRDDATHTTTYEMAFKWSSILPPSVYANFEPGYTDIGFSLLVNDNDGIERTGWQQYMDGIGYGRNPALWGDLILTDQTSFDAPTPPNPDDPAAWVVPPKPDPPFVPISEVSALYATPNANGADHAVGTLFDSQTRYTYYQTEYLQPMFIVFDLGKAYDVDEIWYRTQWDYDGGRINKYSVYSADSADGLGVLANVDFSNKNAHGVDIHAILNAIPGLTEVVDNANAPATVYDDYLLTGQTIGEYRLQFPNGAHANGRYLILVADETKYDDWRMATVDFHYIAPQGPVLDSIRVAAYPFKTSYMYGEDYFSMADIDLSGIVVWAHYIDPVNGDYDELVDPADLSVVRVAYGGTYGLTISYQNKTADVSDISFYNMPALEVTSLTITKNPSKLTYTGNAMTDPLDLTGLAAAVSWTNGDSTAVGASDVTVESETRIGTTNNYTVTISYGGATATFQITRNPVVEGLWITKNPDKLTYYKNEPVSLAGIVANVVYSNGDWKSVGASELAVVGEVPNTDVQYGYTVTFSYGGKTAVFTITRPALMGIYIDTPPAKLSYYHGEAVSLAGIAATAEYADGHTEALAAGDLTLGTETPTGNPNNEALVTVSFMSSPAEFLITRPAVTGIEVTALPAKTSYLEGQAIDLTGIGVTVAYGDGYTETVGAGSVSYAGKQQINGALWSVIVSYQGFTAAFDVTISAEQRTIYMPFYEIPQGTATLPGDYFPGVKIWSDGYPANTLGQIEYQNGSTCIIGNNNGMSHNFLVTSPSFLGAREVWMKIEYYDIAPNTNNWFNYPNGADRGNEGNQKYLSCAGSGQWVSTVYHFTDARFGEALFGGTKDMTLSLRRLPVRSITLSVDPIPLDILVIEIMNLPNKLVYQPNESLDLTGLAVKVRDNSEAGYSTAGPNNVTVVSVTRVGSTDEYVVTIGCAGYTAEFSINRSSEARA
ncbi:MAG: bacterial Ig-like domain-containing protein, partial [Firmicutes bacterium]|nr:bacterial Ig-like domain-containing protein [Bacillota bacterium]